MIKAAHILWILQGLFVLRVLGQVIVMLYAPAWLPPMEEWYSGLIPYPILLPIQLAMIAFMTKVSLDNTRNKGSLHVTKNKTRKILLWISIVYFAVMVARYIIQVAMVPENRWFKGAIPIFFHWVLAAYIYLLARKNTQANRPNPARNI